MATLRSGQPMPTSEVWIIEVESGKRTRVEGTGRHDEYVFPMGWREDGSALILFRLHREFQKLEVLAARTQVEYGIAVSFEAAPYTAARWVSCSDRAEFERFMGNHQDAMAEDRDGAPIYLARSSWLLGHTIENWPNIEFAATRERSLTAA